MSIFTKKKVLVLWYTRGKNYGDYLLYQTVEQHLKKWGYEAKSFEVGSHYEKVLKAAEECSFIWFAGGGIIERYVPSVIQNFEEFYIRSGKKPYGVTGLSIGGFDYSEWAENLKFWATNATFFYSRDEYTANTINRFAEAKRVISGVDVVFANQNIRGIQPTTGRYMGVNFREVPYEDLSGAFRWDQWATALRTENMPDFVGIPDQHDCLGKIGLPQTIPYSPEYVTEILQGVRFSVAMRYHVVLVSAMFGKVSIPIDYCPKVSRLANQLGITELIVGIHDYGNLPEKVQLYLDNESYFQEKLSQEVIDLERRADLMFFEIRKRLKGNKLWKSIYLDLCQR